MSVFDVNTFKEMSDANRALRNLVDGEWEDDGDAESGPHLSMISPPLDHLLDYFVGKVRAIGTTAFKQFALDPWSLRQLETAGVGSRWTDDPGPEPFQGEAPTEHDWRL